MIERLKMTVLVDNKAVLPFSCEWGLSILIDADDRVILLDTGETRMFAENAKLLNRDLSEVDVGVLSHAHYDHSNGLDTFFSLNSKAVFHIRETGQRSYFGIEDGKYQYIGIRRSILHDHADRIQFVSGVYKLADSIWLIPHRKRDYSRIALRNELYVEEAGTYPPDPFTHEQSLVIETEKGLVVFNSCSHTGVANIVADVKEMLGRSDIIAYVGGLHLYNYTDEELGGFCAGLTEIDRIYTGHCTGDHAFDILRNQIGDSIVQIFSGFEADLTSI